jgi:hypothetical protein
MLKNQLHSSAAHITFIFNISRQAAKAQRVMRKK